jgi:hypothetical protein
MAEQLKKHFRRPTGVGVILHHQKVPQGLNSRGVVPHKYGAYRPANACQRKIFRPSSSSSRLIPAEWAWHRPRPYRLIAAEFPWRVDHFLHQGNQSAVYGGVIVRARWSLIQFCGCNNRFKRPGASIERPKHRNIFPITFSLRLCQVLLESQFPSFPSTIRQIHLRLF